MCVMVESKDGRGVVSVLLLVQCSLLVVNQSDKLMSDSSMVNKQHLNDSIMCQWRANQATCFTNRAFPFFCSSREFLTESYTKYKVPARLGTIFICAQKAAKVFLFLWDISSFFLFWPEHSRYSDMPGHIFEKPKCSAVSFCCCTTLSLSSPDLSVQGSSALLGPQSRHRPLGNPRGKANCIFYKSLLLSLPFLPSFFPCFPPSSLPSCCCEGRK